MSAELQFVSRRLRSNFDSGEMETAHGETERETETEKTSRNPSVREGAQWGGAKESRVERGREDSWEYRGFGRD